MIYKTIKALDKKLGFEQAKAHCDVPCGIYDPITAQISALTVVRMMDLMAALEGDGVAFDNSMSRYVAVKEEHAEQAKHEVRIIWGDFISPAHVEEYPADLLDYLCQGMQSSSGWCRGKGLNIVPPELDILPFAAFYHFGG